MTSSQVILDFFLQIRNFFEVATSLVGCNTGAIAPPKKEIIQKVLVLEFKILQTLCEMGRLRVVKCSRWVKEMLRGSFEKLITQETQNKTFEYRNFFNAKSLNKNTMHRHLYSVYTYLKIMFLHNVLHHQLFYLNFCRIYLYRDTDDFWISNYFVSKNNFN